MERCALKVGMTVGIRPADRAEKHPLRPATVIAIIDRPGHPSRAIVELTGPGGRPEVPLWRIVKLSLT